MLSRKHARAIKIRRIEILRLRDNPPNDMTPAQIVRETASLNRQIDRILKEDKAEK